MTPLALVITLWGDGVSPANKHDPGAPCVVARLEPGEPVDVTVGREDRPADTLVGGAVRHVERYLDAPFADGYRSEILPQLPYWMPAVIGSLERGVALFVDYGYPRSEFYLPERSDGTLVCHYRHRGHGDPFHRPGLQDITAFVDFTAVAEAGTNAGFELVGYAPQGQFLLSSGLPALIEEGDEDEAEGAQTAAEEAPETEASPE